MARSHMDAVRARFCLVWRTRLGDISHDLLDGDIPALVVPKYLVNEAFRTRRLNTRSFDYRHIKKYEDGHFWMKIYTSYFEDLGCHRYAADPGGLLILSTLMNIREVCRRWNGRRDSS